MFELGDHMANNDSTTVPIHKLPPRKKLKQPVEEHYDDCGNDFTAINLPDSEPEDSNVTHALVTLTTHDFTITTTNATHKTPHSCYTT